MPGDIKLRFSKRLCSQNLSHSPNNNDRSSSSGYENDNGSKDASKLKPNQIMCKKYQNHGDSNEVLPLTKHIKKEITTRCTKEWPKFLKSESPISINKGRSSYNDVTKNIKHLRNQKCYTQLEFAHELQTTDQMKHHESEEIAQSKITGLFCSKKRLRSQEKVPSLKEIQAFIRENKESVTHSPKKGKVFPVSPSPSKREDRNLNMSKPNNRKLEHSYASTKHTPVKASKQVYVDKECNSTIRRSPRLKHMITDDICSKQSVFHRHKSTTERILPFSGTCKKDLGPGGNSFRKPKTILRLPTSTQIGFSKLLDNSSPKSKQNNPIKATDIKNTINKWNGNRKCVNDTEMSIYCKSIDINTFSGKPKGDQKTLEDINLLSNNCKSNDVKHFFTTETLKRDRKSPEDIDKANHFQRNTFKKLITDTSMNKNEATFAPRRSPRIKSENSSSSQIPSASRESLVMKKATQINQSTISHVHILSNVTREISPRKQVPSKQTLTSDLTMKFQSPKKSRQGAQPTRKSPRQSGESFIASSLCPLSGKQTRKEYTIIKSHDALAVELRNGGKQTSETNGLNDISNSLHLGIETHSKKETVDAKSQDSSRRNYLNATDFIEKIKSPTNSRNVRRKIEFVFKQTDDKFERGKDDSDDEYIPRRKKLRSEVTESELWEGFPPNVRFKRLTPKKKVNMEMKHEHVSSGHDIIQTELENDHTSVQRKQEEKGTISSCGIEINEPQEQLHLVCSIDNDIKKQDDNKSIEKHQSSDIVIKEMEMKNEKQKRQDKANTLNEIENGRDDMPEETDKIGNNHDDNVKQMKMKNHEYKSLQRTDEMKACDQSDMQEVQSSANGIKVENKAISDFSDESIQQILDVNIISRVSTFQTYDEITCKKVPNDDSNHLESIYKSTTTHIEASMNRELKFECGNAEITPTKRKESFSNKTPKRSARLQKKTTSSKKNDVYVYTPLTRHDDLEEKKSLLDIKVEKLIINKENVKRKTMTEDESELTGKRNIATKDDKSVEEKERESSCGENIKETEKIVNEIHIKKIEGESELPNVNAGENLAQDNAAADDDNNKFVSGYIFEGNDKVCEQAQTEDDSKNSTNDKSDDTMVYDKKSEEHELLQKKIADEKSDDNTSSFNEIVDCRSAQTDDKMFVKTSINTQENGLEKGKFGTECIKVKLISTTEVETKNKENINQEIPSEKTDEKEYINDDLTININEHTDEVNEGMRNEANDGECKTTESITEEFQQRESLKIKMKKTRKGAAIIHPRPNNSPFVLLPRISIPHSSSFSNSDDYKEEHKKLSGFIKNEKNENKKQTSTCKKPQLSDKRQLRSSEECDELRLETTPELERTKKTGKLFKQRKRKSSEKSPLKKSKRRVSSPKKSEAMRKRDDAQRLLANKTLEKHACMLWSSGQRRHFQMSNPEASHTEIDDIMRKAWEQMTDKEKLGYFQRANNAMTDEYKHSTTKKLEIHDKLPEIKECKKMLKFMALAPTAQHEELQKWLRLFYEISASEYSKIMLDFKEMLKQKRSELREKYKESFKQKDAEYQSFYRKLLFRKILDVRDKIIDIYEQKVERQQIILREAFDTTIRKIIAGEDLELSKPERSEVLTETLLDLKDLESDLKIAVSGAPISTKSFENVLDGLQQEFECINDNAGDNTEVPHNIKDIREPDSDYAQQILIQSSTTKLPALDVNLVDTVLSNESEGIAECLIDARSRELFLELSRFFDREASNAYNRLHNEKSCCELNNPSCFLTNWMMSDQFHALSRPLTQMTRYDRMLVDSKQLVQFLKGTGPYNVVALPASTIPPNMRRAGTRRGYSSNSKIATSYNNNNNSNNNNSNNMNNAMIETHRTTSSISALSLTGRTCAVPKVGVPRIIQTHVPSLPGHTLLRFTSISSGNIRIHTSPSTH